jgi:hypothetical protein
MIQEFKVRQVALRISGGPKITVSVSFSVTVEISSWHKDQPVKFISSSAPEHFRLEGNPENLLLWPSSNEKTIGLVFPFGKLEKTGLYGGVILDTDMEIPEGF